MKAPDLYAEAVARLNGGWSIIPIRNDRQTGQKRAACKWEPYQRRQPTREELQGLFSRKGLTGLAAILGQVSGGLYARDFDLVEAYQRWAVAYPELSRTLPTYQTGRAFQVVAYHPDPVRTKDLGDGELRGEGVYSVLPPSLHPSGRRYVWRVAGPEVRVTIDPAKAGLARPWMTEGDQIQTPGGTERDRETENQRVRESHEVGRNPPSADAPGEAFVVSLRELIRQALPENEHQNHAKLFLLARGVRALEKREGRQWTAQELETTAFGPWFEQNRFLRPDQSRAQYLGEFLMGYDLVQYPLGEGLLEATWARAATCEPPPASSQFADERMRRLVGWCYQLQLVAGDGPFFLSVRTVAAKLGLGSPRRASAVLRRLVDLGILDEVEKGGPDTNKATRFRYLCGPS